MIKNRKKRLKKIKMSLFIPLFLVISIFFGVIIALYNPTYNNVLYPSVLGIYDSENVFKKLLNSSSESKIQKEKDLEFENIINELKTKKGIYSIYIKDLNNGRIYEYNSNVVIYGASLYKLPTLVAVLKQIDENKIKLTDTLIYLRQDYEGGTGYLNRNSFGTYFNVEQLLYELIKNSDNVAQNILSRKIGFSEILKAYKENTNNINDQFISDNKVNSANIGLFLENILESDYLSLESKKYLFDLMIDTSFEDRFADYLKDNIRFSHKIGNWQDTNSWHDCGIIFNNNYEGKYVVCIMTEGAIYNEVISINKMIAEFINNY